MGLADVARHVIGCHSSQETRVRLHVDDVASNICQAVAGGVREGEHRLDQGGVRGQPGVPGPDREAPYGHSESAGRAVRVPQGRGGVMRTST